MTAGKGPTTSTATHVAAPVPGAASRDPIAVFFGDPQSHLTDVLYLHFREYKRKLIYRLVRRAIDEMDLGGLSTVAIADIGASMGYDVKYVLVRLSVTPNGRLPWASTVVSLLEGDDALIEAGRAEWASAGPGLGVTARYVKADLAARVPLPDASQDLVLCSEVVEHLEEPIALLREICRVLKPNGRLILTTDNCPSLLQRLRRVPTGLRGAYDRAYRRPDKHTEIVGEMVLNGTARPLYGHINLNPTRYWERLAREAGLAVASFGTYESIRRGGGRKTPGLLAMYFGVGFLVSLMPPRLGRFFGDTTALMLRKLPQSVGS